MRVLRSTGMYYQSSEWVKSFSDGEQPLFFTVAHPEGQTTTIGTLALTSTRLLYKAPLINSTVHSVGQSEEFVEIPLHRISSTTIQKAALSEQLVAFPVADLVAVCTDGEWFRYHVQNAKEWLQRIDEARFKATGGVAV